MKPLVVLGDAMLDMDVDGAANRLCPDAPVPVVDVAREWHRPGGAGLAALLAARSVPEVVLVTALGTDRAGRRITALLDEHLAGVLALPLDGTTPCKTRVRASAQPLLRMDRGTGQAAHGVLGSDVRQAIHAAGAILIADYGRGITRHPGLRELLVERAREVPVVWDPHPRGAAPVSRAALVTPNETEARTFLGGNEADPRELAVRLRRRWGCDGVAVTLGERGAVLAAPQQVAASVPEPGGLRGARNGETCGAGDRFAAAAAAALLAGASLCEAVHEAVDSAAWFVAAGGAEALSVPETSNAASSLPHGESAFHVAERVRAAGGTVVATGGCFDLLHRGHISLLRRAQERGDALIVCINSDASVRALKGPGRPIVSEEDRALLLNELSAVDAVAIFDEPSPATLLGRLRPDVWVKGDDYAERQMPEAEVVRGHGGEVVLLDTVDGYSTSRVLQNVTARG